MREFHPWNLELWRQITATRERLPHAMLLAGPAGAGKTALALALARYLTCQAPAADTACGACHSCLLFAVATLPDFHLLSTEFEREQAAETSLFYRYGGRYLDPDEERRKRTKPRRVISIGQIRGLISGFSTRPHTAPHKVALIAPAETMTLSAANALLKLLEEPPADSTLILVSSDPSRLPATIRSRCMVMKVALPAREEALEWLGGLEWPEGRELNSAEAELALQLAGGAPLAAAALVENKFLERHAELIQVFDRLLAGKIDPVAAAEQWRKEDFSMLLLWLQRLVADLVRRHSGLPAQIRRGDETPPVGGARRLHLLYRAYDKISRFRQMAQDQINPQLALEELLLSLQDYQES
ncbi:MAG: DNA polymerase III subunit delta' C-terminal domain-containing protein [Pseudomonadota bacterium]|nr:DNA polymerase III subunit delta' C-terminal domain-containing protein [Pseudomonadota bacterium]